MDNSTAKYYILKQEGISSLRLCLQASIIRTWAITCNVQLSAIHIVDLKNTLADTLSQDFDPVEMVPAPILFGEGVPRVINKFPVTDMFTLLENTYPLRRQRSYTIPIRCPSTPIYPMDGAAR
uniref:Uncharacterized protein n=1 Tax=Sphaerodactylus townsendi TaxID=933632 RepID=A0ACB8G5X8_9SAUR